VLAYLIRHAVTDWVGHGLSGRRRGVPLSARGREEAESLGARLARVSLAAVYSSPLERAMETAAYVAAPQGLPPIPREELVEVDFGEWTGRTFEELDGDPRWRDFNLHRATTRAPGGEGMADVQRRVVDELERYAHRHRGRAVAVVSHADVIRAAILHHLGMPLDHGLRIEIEPAAVSTIALAHWGARVLCLNDTGERGLGP
jgi:probable phosphoglycerate mutase